MALKLLDAFKVTNVIEFDSKIVNYIEQVHLTKDSEVLAYELYYKNILLYKLNKNFDATQPKEVFNSLHKKVGFGMSSNAQYFDPRASMFIYQLLKLGEGEKEIYEFR
ncbi:hypothetical protein [Clostridium sp. USBA 49]|uniref:hypothetical protein n=1 Tax=Clostridium sp. USBA 49 TaxID=1881060 RepID=UPI0011778712|nr:hypothetical protein [Clostridium sp. USBA 49]